MTNTVLKVKLYQQKTITIFTSIKIDSQFICKQLQETLPNLICIFCLYPMSWWCLIVTCFGVYFNLLTPSFNNICWELLISKHWSLKIEHWKNRQYRRLQRMKALSKFSLFFWSLFLSFFFPALRTKRQNKTLTFVHTSHFTS